MRSNFQKAKRVLSTNTSRKNVVAVNGCCYGSDNNPDKGDYLKYCGERFWEFLSGIPTLYMDIIEPLGHEAKERDEKFKTEHSKLKNRLTREFLECFCDPDGSIRWEDFVKLGSCATRPSRKKV